MSTASNKDS